MQMAHGAPEAIVPLVVVGFGPINVRASGGAGTSMVICRRKFPSPSNTWILRLPRSATYTSPRAYTAMLCGVLNCPGPSPGVPHDFTQFPYLSYFAMRELI